LTFILLLNRALLHLLQSMHLLLFLSLHLLPSVHLLLMILPVWLYAFAAHPHLWFLLHKSRQAPMGSLNALGLHPLSGA
jgi:hypothetical protein